MADEIKNTNTTNVFLNNIAELATPEGVQKYLLGTKKNGTPRAVYDVVRDYTHPKKKKKKHKNKKSKELPTSYAFYLSTKDSKKKKKKDKKKKKKDKYWHI